MGRRKRPKTKLTRIRIRDYKKLEKFAKESKMSIPQYIAKMTRRIKR